MFPGRFADDGNGAFGERGFDWDPQTNLFAHGTGDEHWLGRQTFRNGWQIGR